jgi:hypothetical protein
MCSADERMPGHQVPRDTEDQMLPLLKRAAAASAEINVPALSSRSAGWPCRKTSRSSWIRSGERPSGRWCPARKARRRYHSRRRAGGKGQRQSAQAPRAQARRAIRPSLP